MSIAATEWVLTNSTAEGTARLMLLVIADRANDFGACWASVAGLAERARVSVRQAQRLINHLVDEGHVTVDRGVGRGVTSIVTIKGVTDVTFSDVATPEKVTLSVEKVTFSDAPIAEKVTLWDGKGDTLGRKGDILGKKGDIGSHTCGEPNTTQDQPKEEPNTSSSSAFGDQLRAATAKSEEEERQAAGVIAELERIAKRRATADERNTLSEGRRRYGETAVRSALADLAMSWLDVRHSHNVAGWLRTAMQRQAPRASPVTDSHQSWKSVMAGNFIG